MARHSYHSLQWVSAWDPCCCALEALLSGWSLPPAPSWPPLSTSGALGFLANLQPPQSDSVLIAVPAAPRDGRDYRVPSVASTKGSQWQQDVWPGLAGMDITEASRGAEAQLLWWLLSDENITNSTKWLPLQICPAKIAGPGSGHGSDAVTPYNPLFYHMWQPVHLHRWTAPNYPTLSSFPTQKKIFDDSVIIYSLYTNIYVINKD